MLRWSIVLAIKAPFEIIFISTLAKKSVLLNYWSYLQVTLMCVVRINPILCNFSFKFFVFMIPWNSFMRRTANTNVLLDEQLYYLPWCL